MRLHKNRIESKDGSGYAVLEPEDPEDMWHAYNLIREKDLLSATALRKVTTESATGATDSKKKRMNLTIRVTKLDFDSHASQLHVSGQVTKETEFVGVGQYHTLDLELRRQFTLEKTDGWDSVALDTLKEAVDQTSKAQLWAVMMQEGLANIYLVTENQMVVRQKVEKNVPKKRVGSSDHDKSLQSFFQTTFDSLLRQIDISDPKPILLASPGFTAANFNDFIKAKASNGTDKNLRNLLPKIMVEHCSSAHTHSLSEVLDKPTVQHRLGDTKFVRETQLMDRFYELLRKDDHRAWYGPKEIEAAVERGAVGKGGGVLLISNSLFRSQEIKVRQRWVKLVDEVKEQGGEVRTLSSMHESGKRLEDLSGIAAILTYPIEDLDEEVGEHVNGVEDVPVNGARTGGPYEEEIEI